MAVLPVQDASSGNQSVTFQAAANGDQVPSGSRAAGWDLGVVLIVRNADAASKTVTVMGTVYTVPATTGTAVIPVYATAWGTLQTVVYSALTSVTVAVVRLTAAP